MGERRPMEDLGDGNWVDVDPSVLAMTEASTPAVLRHGEPDRRIGVVMAALDEFHVLAGRVTQTQAAHVLARLDALSDQSLSPEGDGSKPSEPTPVRGLEPVAWLVEAERHEGRPSRELLFHNHGGSAAHARAEEYRGVPGVRRVTRTELIRRSDAEAHVSALQGEVERLTGLLSRALPYVSGVTPETQSLADAIRQAMEPQQ